MRFLIASDIHGSSYYTKKLLEVYESSKFDKLIILGDILYHGPRNDLPKGHAPKEVIALLNPLSDQIISVKGNCEAEVDQMVLTFPCLDDTAHIFCDGLDMYLAHGHHPFTAIPKGAVCLSGHTHIPLIKQEDGITYLNPGSISLPKGGFPNSYMIYENRKFTIMDFSSQVLMEIEL